MYLIRRKLFSTRWLRALIPMIGEQGWFSGLDPESEAALESLVEGRPLPDAIAQLELESYMGQTLLRDADVTGMACSLEIRAPFLDAEFAALALAQPPESRLPRRGMRKWPLIEAFRDWVPEANWSRPKQGFGLPFEFWLRNELRKRVEEVVIYSGQAAELLDIQAVRTLWERFQKFPAAIGWSRPWALFVLCHYLRQHKITCG